MLKPTTYNILKNFILIIVFIVFSNVSAQNTEKTIILKDAETNLPIVDATVLVLKTKQILLSNANGSITFSLSGNSNIQITHTSYYTKTIRSSSLKENEEVVFLKSNLNNLDEIILSKQHPQKILKSLVDNSIKKLTVPARLKVYSREFFKLNGVYSYYNDGLMNFQLFSKFKKFDSNILVEQNRSFGLIDQEISADLLGYNLNNIMENYYNFKYLNPLLDAKGKKDYEFLIKAYSLNKDYYVMTAVPLETAKGIPDDYTIIYDKNKKIIIEVSSEISQSTLAKNIDKTALGSRNIYKSFFKTIYRLDSDNYYLVSSREEIGFERIDKNLSTEIEVRNYFLTTNFSNQNYTFKDSEVFKDKTLFNKKNTILTDYWNVSGLTATDEEKEIIESIAERK